MATDLISDLALAMRDKNPHLQGARQLIAEWKRILENPPNV